MMSPIFKQVFTDYILLENAKEWMPILISLMFFIALVSISASWLQKSCLLKLANKIEISKNAVYLWNLLLSPTKFFDKKDSFVLLSKLSASKKISDIITYDVINILFSLVYVVFYFVMMLRLNVAMSLIVLGLVLLNYFASQLQVFIVDKFKKSDESGPDMKTLLNNDYQISSYGLQSIETFKSTASENAFFQHLMNNKSAIVNTRIPDDYENAYNPINDIYQILFVNILLYLSAISIMDRSLTIGTYLALQAYAIAFFVPMNQVIGLRKSFAEYEDLLTSMDKDLSPVEKSEPDNKLINKKKMTDFHGEIRFENVSFEYIEGHPVIENFNLTVLPGQKIAIVGNSGAGKTTLLKLLMGLYAPTSGRITIDGIDVTQIDRHLFAGKVGCAQQEIALYTASIRDNIALWDNSVSDLDIYRAASSAQLHKYVTTLDGTYNYEIKENGRNLSGGQKQLVEISRAFLYDPTVLIFDEAMSSIDLKSVELIENEILQRGCTYIEVTHLISNTICYDEIIVLEKGKIAERGTHEKLMENSKYYSTIFRAEKEQ